MSTEHILESLPGSRLYSEELRVRPFNTAEAKQIYSISKKSDEAGLYELLDNTINLSIYDLALPDFHYLLYWQRVNSYPTFPMIIPWMCKHCGNKNSTNLSIQSLHIEDLNPGYEHGMPLPLPSQDNRLINTRLQLVGDSLALADYVRRHSIKETTEELTKNILIACMIDYGSNKTIEDRLSEVSKFNHEDLFAIQAFELAFNYGPTSEVVHSCEGGGCSKSTKVQFHFNITSFFPGSSDSDILRDRILSIKASQNKSVGDKSDGLQSTDLVKKETLGRTEESVIRNRTDETPSKIEKTLETDGPILAEFD